MTREEAIEVLKDIYNYTRFDTYTTNEARTMAIELLEQEPINDVLEKIKAEIEALSNANPSYTHTCDVVDREDVLDIIDKYKAESEDKE